MAHMRELDHKCGNGWCGKRAVLGVYDFRNTFYGEYCRSCGRDRTKRLNAEEEN